MRKGKEIKKVINDDTGKREGRSGKGSEITI
jgi:hypothetical protein